IVEEFLTSFSCAIFARKYPLSARPSVPTTDNATRCFTPASAPYLRRLRVDVSKNFITAASSQEGEFVTSTTTKAPFSASVSPSPVTVLTPELGDAATASCPCSRNLVTTFDPMSPLPPITTIFMMVTFISTKAFHNCLGLIWAGKASETEEGSVVALQPRSSEPFECGERTRPVA